MSTLVTGKFTGGKKLGRQNELEEVRLKLLEIPLLPTSPRESRFSMAYSHP
jgi:hypothetical protein